MTIFGQDFPTISDSQNFRLGNCPLPWRQCSSAHINVETIPGLAITPIERIFAIKRMATLLTNSHKMSL